VDNRRVVINCAKLTFPANFFRVIFFCVHLVFPFIEFLARSHPTIAQIALAIALATLAALTKCTYYTLDVDAMMPVWALMENGGGRGADVSLLAFVHARSTRASNIGGQMPNKSISLSSIKSL